MGDAPVDSGLFISRGQTVKVSHCSASLDVQAISSALRGGYSLHGLIGGVQLALPLGPEGGQWAGNANITAMFCGWDLTVAYRIERNGSEDFRVVSVAGRGSTLLCPLPASSNRGDVFNTTLSLQADWVSAGAGWKAAVGLEAWEIQPRLASALQRAVLLGVVLVLVAGLAAHRSVVRIVRRDLSDDHVAFRAVMAHGLSRIVDDEEAERGGGWLSVGGDAFVAPRRPFLLAALVGVGAQAALAFAATAVLTNVGAFPWREGGRTLVVLLLVHCVSGVAQGTVTARLLRSMRCQVTPVAAVSLTLSLSALGVHAYVCAIAGGSLAAIPPSAWLLLLALVVVVQGPLALLGASRCGTRGYSIPVEVPVIPRQVSLEGLPATVRPGPTKLAVFALVGFLCFAVVSLDLLVLLRAIFEGVSPPVVWTFIVNLILCAVLVSLLSIMHTFSHLKNESHRWWWDACLLPTFFGPCFLILCSAFAAPAAWASEPASFILFWSYSVLIALVLTLALSAISFLASFAFILKLYTWGKVTNEALPKPGDIDLELEELDVDMPEDSRLFARKKDGEEEEEEEEEDELL
jgi:hypothetical protein